jgi:hypothetical protein
MTNRGPTIDHIRGMRVLSNKERFRKERHTNLRSACHSNRRSNDGIERRDIGSKTLLYIDNKQSASSRKQSSFNNRGHVKSKERLVQMRAVNKVVHNQRLTGLESIEQVLERMGFEIKDLKEEYKLTAEQAAEYAKVFAAHDKDKSGLIVGFV